MPKPRKQLPTPVPTSAFSIGERLSHARKLQGLSQELLAEKLCISRKQISDFENNKTHLTDEMIIRLSIALGISADALLGLIDFDQVEEAPGLRLTRRMRELDQLPELKKKAILKTLDDLIRANS